MRDFVPSPLLLEPRLLEKPWGGRRIETVLGRALPPDVRVGESWEVFDRDGASSVVRNGPLAGRALASLRGDEPFPLLAKVLDASETLSVQVHPDAAAAALLGGEAKSECWHILAAATGSKVYRGLRDGCGRAELEAALARGAVEECLHSFEVAAGDTVFVPAGTVHSIGRGVLLFEVQQNSDTTFRLFDFGRGRTLHVREALESVRFGPRSPDKVSAQVVEDEGSLQRLLLIRCPAFSLESLTAMGTFTLDVERSPGGIPAVLHVVSGAGEFQPFRRRVAPVPFRAGDTFLLPTADESFEIVPGATVFRALLARA